MNRDKVIEVLEIVFSGTNNEIIRKGVTQAISLIKENGELRKENEWFKEQLKSVGVGGIEVKVKCLEIENTELKAKYEELKGKEEYKVAICGRNYGRVAQLSRLVIQNIKPHFKRVKFILEDSESKQELADLKKAVASEGLGVDALEEIIREKIQNIPIAGDWDRTRCCYLNDKAIKGLVTSIHEAQTKYKKELLDKAGER